jgi:glyoxylase-like metal-dependent hydrolase (beta-lactamase superfamily II)
MRIGGLGRTLNDDPETALASLDRLEAIDAELVLFAHGEPWTGGLRRALGNRPRLNGWARQGAATGL